MADAPMMFDDLQEDQDPQSAMISRGQAQLGQAALASKPVQNIITGEGLRSGYQRALSAAQGNPEAQQEQAEASLGTAMGSLKELPKSSLAKKDFSILTAENPNAKQLLPAQNKVLNDKLIADLKSKGANFKQVEGSYGPTKENSILVEHNENFGPEEAAELSKKYGQESVIHKVGNKNKLEFVTGENAGKSYQGEGINVDPSLKENYTKLGNEKFNLGLNFEKLHDQPTLTHYSVSEKPLDIIDPAKMGSGSQGREMRRGKIIPRSYYYESESKPEDVVLQNAKTVHSIIRPNKILDLASPEAEPYLNKSPDFNEVEEEIKKAGYEGYKNSAHPTIPGAVALFNAKVPIKGNKIGYAKGGHVGSQSMMFDDLTPDSQPQTALSTHPVPFDELKSDEDVQQEKYGTPIEQAKAGAEAFGRGVAGPIFTGAERLAGVEPEAMLGREEANPVTAGVGEAAGLIGPALVTGPLAGAAKFTVAGGLEALAHVLPEAGETLASKIGTGAAKAAIDNMLLSGGDEVSHMIMQDPNTSASNAIAHIGLNGAIGGVLGGALGAAGRLWKATGENKAGQTIADFQSRIQEHLNNPEPVEAAVKEFGDYYKDLTNVTDEVYGPKGLKAEEIAKTVPEQVTPKIVDQVSDIVGKLDSSAKKLINDKHVGLLEEQINKFKQAVNSNEPGAIFNSIQDLKQQLQEYSKYNANITPLGEKAFRMEAKSLAHDLRTSLEDPSVWGKAGERQAAINSAFTRFKPSLDKIESVLMDKIPDIENGGFKKVPSPSKLNTFLNQQDKPTGATKRAIVSDFFKTAQRYKDALADTHANLGLENPFQPVPVNTIMSALNKKTTGAKLADAFIAKGLTEGGGKALGAVTGGAVGGALAGHGGAALGAILGQHALGPFFNSALPALAKHFVEKPLSPPGVKASIDYTMAVVRGEKAASRAAKYVFSREVAKEVMPPSNDHLDKLDKKLQAIQKNPNLLLEGGNKTSHYLPDHGQAMDMTTASAIQYLNSIRPDLSKKGPLDPTPVESNTQKAAYRSALVIAQDPLSVLDKVKNGNITSSDLAHIGNMYPDLYKSLQQKLTNELTTHVSKGEMVPYKTRLGLSIFMTSPMDSTMTPASLQAAQSQSKGAQPPAQQAAPKRGTKSAPGLQKMPGMYQTSSQALAARHQKD